MSNLLRRHGPWVLNCALAFGIAAVAMSNFQRPNATSKSGSEPAIDRNSTRPELDSVRPSIEPTKLAQYSAFKSASDRRRWLVDQLRAMGVPNEVLALVARVDYEAQWDPEFKRCGGDRAKLARAQLNMDLVKDAEMRAALGDAGFKQWDQATMLWEAMSAKVDVSPAEADALYQLKKKLQQRELELDQAKVNGTMDDAELGAASDKAHADYNQQLKALLGDERYAKSQQLDDTFAAGNLQYTLAKYGASPTDAQFQTLFQTQQQADQALLQLDPSAPDYTAKYQALTAARDEAFEQTLGSNVFGIYQERQDPGYAQMKKYEELWGLSDEKIDYVYNTMKGYEASVQIFQAQISSLQAQGQSVDGLNQKLKQITDQTGQALQGYLGPDSFAKLQRNHLFLFQ